MLVRGSANGSTKFSVAGTESTPRKKATQIAECLLVWAPTAYEYPLKSLDDARRMAATVANEKGEPCTIYTRRRWNNRVIDTPLEEVPPLPPLPPLQVAQ